MDRPEARRWINRAASQAARPGEDRLAEATPAFDVAFAALFEAHHRRLLRVLVRLSGDPELAADLIQEAFVRLYRRGSLPDSPEAWLVTVALNRLRNERATQGRRLRLLVPFAEPGPVSLPPTLAEASASLAAGRRVRAALDRLAERDRQLLVLRAEGYRYGEIAAALQIHEASVGTLLARARRAFLAAYGEDFDARG